MSYKGIPIILMCYIEDYIDKLHMIAQVAQDANAISILFPDLLFEHIDLFNEYTGVDERL